MRILLLSLYFILSFNSHAKVTSYSIELRDGRKLPISISYPKSGKQSKWIIYLPGSTCSYHKASDYLRKKYSGDKDTSNLIVINKFGVNPKGLCDYENFHRYFKRHIRISDTLEIVNLFVNPEDTVSLIGVSEGAYLAPDIALLDRRVQKVIMLSGGTRGWPFEELHKSPHLVDFFYDVILKFPRFDLLFIRGKENFTCSIYECKTDKQFSFSTLASYHNDKTFKALAELNIPTLMINGDRDSSVWIGAVERDVNFLTTNLGKNNINIKIFRGVGHNLKCLDLDVCQKYIFMDQILPTMAKFLSTSF